MPLDVVGVLAPTGTPDDEAVFTGIKTTWVIAGIGCGREGVLAADAGGQDIVAAASISEFNRITPENIDNFHFHGDPESYPVLAVILAPEDARACTMMRGRYLDPQNPVQLVLPGEVVGELVDRIFPIKSLLDAVTLIVGLAAIAAVGLAVFLGDRLRAPEMRTAFELVARRGMILRLLATETVVLLCIGFLQNSGLRHDGPCPHSGHARPTIPAVPRSERRFMRAMRMWSPSVRVSGGDTLARGFEVERVSATGSSEPAAVNGGAKSGHWAA